MKAITVFTPTFNREKLLNQLYNSLLNQTFKDFEWLIVDDGSTDNTKELIEKFISENKICIRYFYKENGGKHRAINKGIDTAEGNLFIIVDSDDYLTYDALETINEYEKKINSNDIAGVCGLKGKNKEALIGTTFEGSEIDIYNYDRKKYKISGDKAEAYYTQILKKYKFPEYDGEKFINEALVWNKIALDGYKLKYFNKIIYLCDYLDDGLTKNIDKILENNPIGFKEYINQLLMINKKNLFEKIKLVSFYQKILKNKYTKKEMCKQLNVSMFFMNISCFIRKIFKRG